MTDHTVFETDLFFLKSIIGAKMESYFTKELGATSRITRDFAF